MNKDIVYYCLTMDIIYENVHRYNIIYHITTYCLYMYIAPPVVQGVTVIPNVTKISRSPSLIVSWSAPVGDDITYVVLYSTIRLTNPLQGSVEREASCPSIYLTGLTRGTRYYIWVCAVADGLHGPYSTVTMAPTVNSK